MHPASVAPAACPADTPAAPKTPASSPPCAGRSRIVAPLPAGSAPPRTPLVAPVRIAPRLSSLRLQPSGAEDYLLPDFYSGAAGLSGRFSEGFFHRRLQRSTLSSILYEIDSHGRMKIESKEDARKRGVRSPDRADALMLALS